jgi:hypothetical protein
VRPVFSILGDSLARMQKPIASVPIKTRPIRGVGSSLPLPYVTPSALKLRAMDTKGAHGCIDHSPGPSPPPWPPYSPTALRMTTSPGLHLMMSKLYLLLRSTGVNAVAAHFYDLPKCSCADCIWLEFTLCDIPRNGAFLLDREVGLGKRKGSSDMRAQSPSAPGALC